MSFSTQVNRRLAEAKERENPLFMGTRLENFARIVNQNTWFPFSAQIEGQCIILCPALEKSSAPVIKDISDGFTEVAKTFAADMRLSECEQFALSQLFMPAIYATYREAGMSEGPHTKYTDRGC